MTSQESYVRLPDPPFLEADPPPWAVRALARLLLLLFVVAAIGAAVVRIPETVSAPFVLVPERGTDPVRASHRGTVTVVRVSEGQAVAEGEATFVIRSEAVGDRSAELGSLEARLKGIEEALANARSRYQSQRQADEKERTKLEERLAYLDRALDINGDELAITQEVTERYRELRAQGLVSAVEFSQRQLDVHRAAQELAEREAERRSIRSSAEKLGHETDARWAEQQESERLLAEERAKSAIRLASLREDLGRSVGGQVFAPAPCAGTIVDLQVRAPGAFVEAGTVLCELACSQDRIQAELTIPSSGVSMVAPGQAVKLLYEAFPYQRFGVRRATVRWVTPASVHDEQGASFRARADIEDGAVVVQGQSRPLKPGMRGLARIVVGRRTLLSYAFEPVRRLREDLAEVPPPRSGR